MLEGSIFGTGTRVFVAAMLLAACSATGEPVNSVKAGASGPPTSKADVPQDWLFRAQQNIAQSEYNVTWQDHAALPGLGAAWQAPNRAHDLRTYFTSAGPRVVRRTDEVGSWTWGLELTGFGGGVSPSSPPSLNDVCTEGNRITFERDGLAEWYVNSEAGLEQGFTIYKAPESGTEVVVRMGVRGDLTAGLTSDGQTAEFLSAGGVVVMRYGNLHVTDAAGKSLPATMALQNGDSIELRVNADGAAFPLTIDPLATNAAWMAESNQASAYFGTSVSTAGDVNGDGYSDVIIGTSNYDNGETDEGRAYVFYGSASGLSISPNWTAESNQAGSHFGMAVSTAGDVNGDGYSDVIVGAPQYSNGETGGGAAFVYLGSASGLSAAPNWTAEGNQAGSYLGTSVSTAGDVNGDGYSDVVVGVPGWSNGQTGEGAAFLYYGSAAGLSVTANWSAESGQADANFGYSVSTAGDVNGDGYSDVIIGALAFDAGLTNAGAAFVYYGSAAGLPAFASWSALGGQAAAEFGFSVATAGDVNGDGYSDIIVGAPLYDGLLTDQGRAYVYYGSATGPSGTEDRILEISQSGAYFGYAVSTAGDVNGDGYADVIVGAPFYGNGQNWEGASFVFYGSALGLSSQVNWSAESDQASAYFGRAVSAAGDVNGDGYGDIIIGAPYFDNGQTDEGRAFVYYGSASTPSAAINWNVEGDGAGANLGYSVSAAGDVNGDGFADVIVGAPYYDHGKQLQGAAFVYHGSASGLSATADWQAEGGMVDAELGYSVAAAGDVNGDGYGDVIIGAPHYTDGESYEGAAFVYYGSPTGLFPAASWMKEGNQANAHFGSSVSTAGDVNGDGYSDIVVGSEAYSNGQTGEGRAFVYHGSPSGLSASPNWTAESDQANAMFGNSVSTAGDVNGDGYSDVIIGARQYNTGQTYAGRAYLYYGSSSGLSASANWTAQGDQVNEFFGHSVSTAGDVNGDGYSDVIVGAYAYSNGQPEEGRVYVYHGSASGLSPAADWTAESDQAGALFGTSVSTAGDVNGDGYSDVIIGAYGYSNGLANAGRAYVFYGSVSGLHATANWTVDGDKTNAALGWSVSAVGDVNGDGYSDVIVGAYGRTNGNGQSGAGAAAVYYGNGEAGRGLTLHPRQRLGDDSAPLAPLGRTVGSDVRLAALGRTPFGRSRVKLECEVKPVGTPFDGTGTVKTASWTSTGVDGVELSQHITGLWSGAAQHWRLRLLYNPATSPVQQKSRWLTAPVNGWEEADFRTPVIPMTGGIVINSNRSATNNPVVTLALTWAGGAGTGVVRMRFSNDGSTWTAWGPLAASKSYTLPAGDGHKTVRVQYLDKLNNKSAIYSDYILLDTTLPTGSIIINNGAATTATRSVTLKLTWADAGAGVSRMRFSDDGAHWTAWTPQTASRPYTLPAGLGYHTVRAQFLDGANNYSAVYNDYIKLVAP